jgi:hypothetical protein
MPPALSDYQTAATNIYEPQKQAEQIALTATRDTTKNSLEAQKGQVNTTYTDAIQHLQQAIEDQSGQINQLYSQRLGGNFSGLQGNDMGKMFSRANQQQSVIEQTRANKLNEITTGETNADINYGAGVAALTPKYQSLESEYASNAYGSAVKDYKDTQYKNAQLSLGYARLASSNANAAAGRAQTASNQFKVAGKYNSNTGKNDFSNGYAFTGPNGKPVSMSQYISGAGMGGQDIVDLLSNGSKYDRAVAAKVAKANPQNDNQLIAAIKKADTGRYYGF